MTRRTNARLAAALAVMTVLGAVAVMSPAGADTGGINHMWRKHFRKKLRNISNAVSGFDNQSGIPNSVSNSFEELDVPKGRYAINASLYVDDSDSAVDLTCELSAGGDLDRKVDHIFSTESDVIALQVVHQFDSAGTIFLRCADGQGVLDATTQGHFIKITAIEVPKLTNVAI